MKKLFYLIVTIISIGLIAQTSYAETSSWYVGIGVGSSSTEIESGILNDGSTISGESKDEDDTSLSFFIGYEVNDNISVEGGYINFGEANATGTSDGTGFFWWPGAVEMKFEATAIFLDIMGKYSINDRFDLFGKAGIYDADLDVDLTDSWGTISESDSNTGLLFGVGLSCSFNEKISGRASWTRFNDVGDGDLFESDVDILGLDLVFSFN